MVVRPLLYRSAIAAHESNSEALTRLFPARAGTSMCTVAEIVSDLHRELVERSPNRPSTRSPNRPYVLLNMASTADGRASIGGRAGPIGNRTDSELLHGLRTVVDGLLVGAETVRREHYARLLRDDCERRLRSERGLKAELVCCIVSASLALSPGESPLLAERGSEVVVLTPSEGTIADGEGKMAARVEYVRAGREGALDLAAALHELHTRFSVRSLVCEGGPSLAAHMLAAHLVDELWMCLAPKLAGGGAEKLRIVSGTELAPTVDLELASVFEHEAHLFLRYRVVS